MVNPRQIAFLARTADRQQRPAVPAGAFPNIGLIGSNGRPDRRRPSTNSARRKAGIGELVFDQLGLHDIQLYATVKGRARWTVRLLENKVVELGIVERATDSTVGRKAQKAVSSRIVGNAGSSAESRSAFVAAIEDVFAVCMRPRDSDRPLVCQDESSKLPIPETRVPIATNPGARVTPCREG